ncbi:bifunctional pyr operon transcriptional regulator/uracil phosphoribosyltransferase [candidate division WOR-3 bacterium RBG_13_43_14]|uniref:Bifunctional protein PyrR n=1 Tax=candidate division WOR-3 bacterium RBG_13_43_14 TaxID=1802590 RepID=A0A1F4UEK1_UNCW3|nr:MAG: bifunctional pyr operon transcriptional regulator/uracil phosphoribosyltransferase [candidate division WOR-3 bacterium RBG_13_43_14]
MKKVVGAAEIRRALIRIAHEIIEKNNGIKDIILIGIKRRGDYIARRLADFMKTTEKRRIPIGALDITLYRDDLQLASDMPIIESTDIPFDVTNRIVVLVDDVLYTGRTIRAAIEEILDFGRPKAIQLAVLVDRGHRELPIQADYTGKKMPAARNEIIDVLVREIDGEDCIVIHDRRKKTKKQFGNQKTRIGLKQVSEPMVKQLKIGGSEDES